MYHNTYIYFMSNYINLSFKARYETLGNTSNPKKIWIVLHGYGQQAQFFMRKFKPLIDDDTLIIAPEGLHRFYLKGYDGRVGASWMTKEDRLIDIENYLSYLNSIINHLEFEICNLELNLIGFSQGAATASRWLNEGKVKFNKLVLWSSVFPEDLDFELIPEQLEETSIYFCYGNDDEFMPSDRVEAFKSKLSQLNLKSKICNLEFQGGHDIDAETLLKVK